MEFRNSCNMQKISRGRSYGLFLIGRDSNNNGLRKTDYVERGFWLMKLKKCWMRLIGYNVVLHSL